MKTKTITITRCEECPFYVFDDSWEPRRWGKRWCEKLDQEVPRAEEIIPDECPLP